MSLASLPTELIEAVAICLDLPSSCSLRLASSSLQKQSLHVFRDRFYRKRSVAWTRTDLDRLVEISKHVVLGSALQQLIIDATPRRSMSLWQLRKRITEADAVFGEPNGVCFKSELQEMYVEREREARTLTTFFNETRYDQKCLRDVFSKAENLNSIIFEYKGMDKKYGKFGRRYCESGQHEMSRPFVSTMAVIAALGVRLNEIAIHPVDRYGAVSIGRLESLAPALRSFDQTFEGLEILDLNLRDWRYPDEGFELENGKASFIVRFLAKARNTRHLSIDCYSSLQNDLIGEMARHCTFSKLETCKLSHFLLHSASDLVQLLIPSFSALKGLALSHIRLLDGNTGWSDLLRNLASSENTFPVMEWVHLIQLFTKSGARLSFNGGMGQEQLFLGPGCLQTTWRDDMMRVAEMFSEGTWEPAYQLGAAAYPFIGMRT